MPENEVELKKEMKLTEKEWNLIELMRQLVFFKIEVHGEDGQPVRVIDIKKNIKL